VTIHADGDADDVVMAPMAGVVPAMGDMEAAEALDAYKVPDKNPYDTVGFLSKISWSWMGALVGGVFDLCVCE
jgi:hypothetical protein